MLQLPGGAGLILPAGVHTYQAGLGASPFSPLDLSPALWLKADAGTFQTVSGSAALADGDPVGQWLDQSGNGLDVTQTTAGRRPLLKTATINGLPTVRSDGVDDWLATTSAIAPASMTFFFAGQFSAGFLAGRTMFVTTFFDGANSHGFDFSFDGSANLVFNTYHPAANGMTCAPPSGSNTPFMVSATFSAGSKFLYLDRVQKATASGLGAIDYTGNVKTHVANQQYGDVDGTNIWHFPGDIGELIVYSTALSDANRQSVEAYLQARWNTP